MSFDMNFEEVLRDAKKAFQSIERTEYERNGRKRREKLKPFFKDVGYIDGMKKVLVWR